MAKMTQAQHKRHATLRAALDKASERVFDAGRAENLRWSDCYKLASKDVQEAYDSAHSALMGFESDMVSQGRAWRSNVGAHFTPNYR
jgi:hypothetical protein